MFIFLDDVESIYSAPVLLCGLLVILLQFFLPPHYLCLEELVTRLTWQEEGHGLCLLLLLPGLHAFEYIYSVLEVRHAGCNIV